MRFNKRNYVAQVDTRDCGVAVLSMVARHYGSRIRLATLREMAKTTLEGTTALGLVKAAEQLGMTARAIRADRHLFESQTVSYPFIVHVLKHGKLPHYYLVIASGRDWVKIADPDRSVGIRKLPLNVFEQEWTGVCLFMAPAPSYEPKREQGDSLSQLLPLLGQSHGMILNIVCASLLVWGLTVVGSFYMQAVVDTYIPSSLSRTLGVVSLGMMGMYVFQKVLQFAKEYLLVVLGQRLSIEVILAYIRHLFRLPMSFYATRRTGEMTSRFSDASTIIETLAHGIVAVCVDSLVIILMSILLLYQNPTLFLLSIASLPLYAALILGFIPLFRRLAYRTMESNAILSSSIIEDINGIETIKSLAVEANRYHKIDAEFAHYLQQGFQQAKVLLVQSSLKQGVQCVMMVLILGVGAYQVMEGRMSLGQLLAFQALMGYFNSSLEEILGLQSRIQSAKVANSRLNEVFFIEKEQTQETMRIRDDALEGPIHFETVSYRYGYGKDVLHQLSLMIPQGSKIAIVGLSGSGKSTLGKLLVNFYPVASGRITVNGYDIAYMDQSQLRRQVHYLPQEPYIFSGTIYENLTLGMKEGTTFETVQAICALCEIQQDIESLPQGYQTTLTSDSTTLSGGQKQRIALARALLADASVYILDESTSQLDLLTEDRVIRHLLQLEKTIIFIAHRLSIAEHCDSVVVLHEGRVVQQGSHEQLVNEEGLYQQLQRRHSHGFDEL